MATTKKGSKKAEGASKSSSKAEPKAGKSAEPKASKASSTASAKGKGAKATKTTKAASKTTKAGKTGKAAKGKAGKEKAGKGKEDKDGKRKLGLRGAAPWAARHAAKHAAEARARAAEPPLPGSARATIRTPAGAEGIKVKVAAMHTALTEIKGFRKQLPKTFFDIGVCLRDIQNRKLFESKGYGSFDAFLEREIDLGKTTSLRLVKVSSTFQREAALEYGMDRCFAAIIALEAPEGPPLSQSGGLGQPSSMARLPTAPVSTPSLASLPALPLKPPGRI